MPHPLQQKSRWLLMCAIVAILLAALSVGFNVNPSPQPQRVSDLVARIEDLESENADQADALTALSARLDVLETLSNGTSALVLSNDVVIPRDWVQDDSSDGTLRYWHDPSWELTNDEPGTMDLWLNEDTAIFFSWDWSFDLLADLHNDEEFLNFFEKDLLSSDDTIQMNLVKSDALTLMGEDAHYWEIRIHSTEGYSSRMLTVFYPCSDRASCNIIFVRFDPDQRGGGPAPAFDQEEWDFINTFVHGIKFLTDGKTTVRANANVRVCPAIECEITGRLVRGEIVELVAISADGYWYQLESGGWIASNLIFGAPEDLPVLGGEDEI